MFEDREAGFEHAVDGEEGIRHDDAAHYGAGDITLVPLVAGQSAGHGNVTLQDGVEAIDALAGAAVHLVGHRTGTGLTGRKTFAGKLVPGHQPQGFSKTGGATGEIAQSGNDTVVEAARINLSNSREGAGQTQMVRNLAFQCGDLFEIAPEEIDLVQLRARGSLQATHRVAGNNMFQCSQAAD